MLLMLPWHPSVRLSPLHPVHPHPMVSPVAASTRPQPPAASHPHPFHHDLVLGYFGKRRGPPGIEAPPWVPLLVALSPPWEVTVV